MCLQLLGGGPLGDSSALLFFCREFEAARELPDRHRPQAVPAREGGAAAEKVGSLVAFGEVGAENLVAAVRVTTVGITATGEGVPDKGVAILMGSLMRIIWESKISAIQRKAENGLHSSSLPIFGSLDAAFFHRHL